MFLQPVISCKQSGFRKQDSTEFQLTRLVQHWSTAMDRSQFFGVLFLDIKKAFDCVYLPGLIYKLQSAGVHGNALNWFRNFLLDCRQRTIIGQSVSALEYLHADVPQGAILSPLLFSLYMNHITASTCGDVNLFADDTSAFTVSDSVQNLQPSLQTVANDLSSWFKSWALTINVEKTAVMVLCTRQKFQPFLSLSMAVRSSKCVSRNTIDERLTWTDHVSTIVKRLPQNSACYAGCDPVYHLWLSKLSSALVFFLFWSTHPLPGVVLVQSR